MAWELAEVEIAVNLGTAVTQRKAWIIIKQIFRQCGLKLWRPHAGFQYQQWLPVDKIKQTRFMRREAREQLQLQLRNDN